MLFKSTVLVFSWILLWLSATLQAEPSIISDQNHTRAVKPVNLARSPGINLQDAITWTFEHNPALRAFSIDTGSV